MFVCNKAARGSSALYVDSCVTVQTLGVGFNTLSYDVSRLTTLYSKSCVAFGTSMSRRSASTCMLFPGSTTLDWDDSVDVVCQHPVSCVTEARFSLIQIHTSCPDDRLRGLRIVSCGISSLFFVFITSTEWASVRYVTRRLAWVCQLRVPWPHVVRLKFIRDLISMLEGRRLDVLLHVASARLPASSRMTPYTPNWKMHK
jgi:hypothetical protein